jgi:hypothetical protein
MFGGLECPNAFCDADEMEEAEEQEVHLASLK